MSENENIVIRFPTLEPDDVSSCEEVVRQLFECIKKWQNEDEARRIFGPYGKPRTKREINNEENENLLTEYYLEFIKAEKFERQAQRAPTCTAVGQRKQQ